MFLGCQVLDHLSRDSKPFFRASNYQQVTTVSWGAQNRLKAVIRRAC